MTEMADTTESVETAETHQRKPGRPRSVQADLAILEATLELIAQDGVQGMSLEGVAARAGVSKTTIYRRWANKDALVIDALRQIKRPVASFDTGNFRADMTQFLASLRVILDEPLIQRVTFQLLGEVASRREWAQTYFRDVVKDNFDGLYGMIERARIRGELRADVDLPLIMDLIGGPLFYHFVVSLFFPDQAPFPVEQFVDLLWEGLRPGGT